MSSAVYRRDADEPAGEPLVKFRLFYQGPLYASKGDPFGDQVDRKRAHKHEIRRAFHRQLKYFWQVHPWLSKTSAGTDVLGLRDDPNYKDVIARIPAAGRGYHSPYMWEHLAYAHRIGGRSFVPLVCEQFKLLCELNVLLLRRDRPGGIFQARDIDNRLKTLFDALRVPKPGSEIGDIPFAEDEDPLFVLLQDDSLITNVRVETDELLDPPDESGKDDSYVRLLVEVRLHPYEVNMFNISFA